MAGRAEEGHTGYASAFDSGGCPLYRDWIVDASGMMEAVPMDTKYWKVKIIAAFLLLLPVFAGLLWGSLALLLL